MNFQEITTLRKAFNSLKEKQRSRRLPGLEAKKRKLKDVRELCVGNEEILNQAIARLEENGVKVYKAKGKDDAVSLVLKEIGEERLVIKSKSNVTKEVELVEELKNRGITVVETDIGDRILQLLNAVPSHPTGPIAHISAKQIAEELSKHYGRKVEPRVKEIVALVKEDILRHINKTRVGITGANAITAEEGSIILVHNEGNIFESMRKEKHIVVTGIDKIYPNIEEAVSMIKILTYNATGSVIPSFVEIISGISKTADVEKEFYTEVHSPKEIVLILVDNKRSKIVENGFKELLYCIGCGACLVNCPVYNTFGHGFAEGNLLGGKGLVYYSAYSNKRSEKLELCLTCKKCKENCPVEIDIPKIIREMRSNNISSEIYYFLKSHVLWIYTSLMFRLKKDAG